MSDSWESFLAMLDDEVRALAALQEAAQALSRALAEGKVEPIRRAQEATDEARKAFGITSSRRRGMQARGFGTMTLRQVCARAPRRYAGALAQRLGELTVRSIGLRITARNNKALVLANMERLMSVTAALQRAASENLGTYRRRGFVPPPTNSVLVSSKA